MNWTLYNNFKPLQFLIKKKKKISIFYIPLEKKENKSCHLIWVIQICNVLISYPKHQKMNMSQFAMNWNIKECLQMVHCLQKIVLNKSIITLFQQSILKNKSILAPSVFLKGSQSAMNLNIKWVPPWRLHVMQIWEPSLAVHFSCKCVG